LKAYIITRAKDGKLILLAQKLVKGKLIEEVGTSPDGYDIGNASKETLNLARAILNHYYGVSPADPAAQAEAARQQQKFMDAMLTHHQMPPGSTYEIPGEVLDRFFSLQ
jgi:hypothetical protein